jgi:hypothetical protein
MYRSGKVMHDRFYIISIGRYQDEIVVEAFDQERELLLTLKLEQFGVAAN